MQKDFGVIDPNSKSGSQLALDLNDFRDAVNTCHRGPSRPPYARPGMLWVKEVSAELEEIYLCGTTLDTLIGSVNPKTQKLIPVPLGAGGSGADTAAGARAAFEVLAAAQTTYQDSATGATNLPVGGNGQRPSTPKNGMLRFNTELPIPGFEGYMNGRWGGIGGGTDAAFLETDSLIKNSYRIGQTFDLPCTISIATPAVITQAHNYVAGQQIHLFTSGALPTGLSADTPYFVLAAGLAASSFRVSLTRNGPAVNTSGAQSGAHVCGPIKNAVTPGPVEVADDVVVTVPVGSAWTIV